MKRFLLIKARNQLIIYIYIQSVLTGYIRYDKYKVRLVPFQSDYQATFLVEGYGLAEYISYVIMDDTVLTLKFRIG